MATARAEKTPMRIQNRIDSTLFFSILNFAARDVAIDVPVLLLNQPSMATATCDGEESSLFQWNKGHQGLQHTMTTIFRHPPFPNLPPKM